MDKDKAKKMHEHLMVNDPVFYEMVVDHQLKNGNEAVDLAWSICKTIDKYIQRDIPNTEQFFFTKDQVIELLGKFKNDARRLGITPNAWLDIVLAEMSK